MGIDSPFGLSGRSFPAAPHHGRELGLPIQEWKTGRYRPVQEFTLDGW